MNGAQRIAKVESRSDWVDEAVAPTLDDLSSHQRALLAEGWTKIALLEHASIAAFARFTLQLLSLGAPAELIERSNAAMADETMHTRLAFSLASAYAGHRMGPSALDMHQALDCTSFETVVVDAIREGCIGETIAAVHAAEALARAVDPEVRRVLARIVEDETRHADLAWRFVRWAIERGDSSMRRSVEQEFARACRPPFADITPETGTVADRETLLAGGILTHALSRVIHREVSNKVIRVCAQALLCETSRAAELVLHREGWKS